MTTEETATIALFLKRKHQPKRSRVEITLTSDKNGVISTKLLITEDINGEMAKAPVKHKELWRGMRYLFKKYPRRYWHYRDETVTGSKSLIAAFNVKMIQ